MGKSYTNIAGGEFKPWVDKQINLRQAKLSQKERDTNTLQFSTNRNSWYRVTSMSKIIDGNPLIAKYGDRIKGGNLANDFVLQGGVIKKTADKGAILRYGLGKADLNGNGSYGGLDIDELGYKPMPGITNLEIGTGGKLGVLQEIKIDFKCHNLAQLEIIEILYMKLGFSVFVEFGHTNYFTNDGKHVNSPLPFNPWKYEKKEDLLKATQNKRVSESGNWGGLLGTVKNFSWEINTDGSYDCKIEVVGAGDILESLRTNQNSEKASGISQEEAVSDQEDNTVNEDATDTGGFGSDQTNFLPSVVANRFSSIFENIIYSLYEFGISNYEDQNFSAGDVPPPNFITTKGTKDENKAYVKLLNKCFGNSPYSGLKFTNKGEVKSPSKEEDINGYFASRGNSYQVMRHHLDGEEAVEPPVVSSKLFTLFTGAFNPNGEDARQIDANDDNDDEGKPMVFITLGHLLAIMNHHCNIFYGKDKKSATPYIKIDYHQDYTFGSTNITQFSCDPSVCLIPFRDKGGLVGSAIGTQINSSFKEGGTLSDAAVIGEIQAEGSFWNLIYNSAQTFNPTSGAAQAALFNRFTDWLGGDSNSGKVKKVVNDAKALKNVVAEEEDDANKVTAVLNDQSPYYDSENPNRGKLMEILVNCNFITSTLAKLQSPDTNQVSTAQLLDEILKGISKSIGGANDFRLYPDDETNVLRILDDKINDPSKTKYTELKIFGLGNTVYDYGFSSKISNDLATQIVVSAQANPEGINADDYAFSHLNRGIVDRLAPVKMTTDIDPDGNSSNKADSGGNSPLTMLTHHLANIYCGMQYNANDVNASINVGLKFVNQLNAKDPVKRGQTLIPLEFSLTMDGITGLIPHSAFIIDKNRLPDSYRIQSGSTKGNARIAFILHSITHNFNSNKWNTTIKGQTLNIDFEGKDAESNSFQDQQNKIDKNTPKAKTPPQTSSNGETDDGENVASVTLDKKEAPLVENCVYPEISPSDLNEEFYEKIIYGVIAHAPSVFGGTGKAFNDFTSLDGGTIGIAHYARGGLADFLEYMIDKYGYSTFFSRGSKSEVIKIAKNGVKHRDIQKNGATPYGVYYVSWVKEGIEKIVGNSKYDTDQFNFLKQKRLRAIKAVYNKLGNKGWNTERAFAIVGAIANSYGGGFYKKSWMQKYLSKGPDYTAYYYQYKFGQNDFSNHKSTRIKIINQMFPCDGKSAITGAQVKAGTPLRTRKVKHVPR